MPVTSYLFWLNRRHLRTQSSHVFHITTRTGLSKWKENRQPMILPDLGKSVGLPCEGCDRSRKIAFLLMAKEAGSN